MLDDELIAEWVRYSKKADMDEIYEGDITIFEYFDLIYSEISNRHLGF